MSTVLQAAGVYLVLLLFLRCAGRRTMADLTTFDFVLLLIIGEATQGVLTGHDPSMATFIVVVGTLIGLDVLLSLIKLRFPGVDRLVDGIPLVIVRDGVPDAALMRRARVSLADVLAAGRITQGVGSLAEIRYAILEASGEISIVPR